MIYLGRQDLQRLCPAPHKRCGAEGGAINASATLLPTVEATPWRANSVVKPCVDKVNRRACVHRASNIIAQRQLQIKD